VTRSRRKTTVLSRALTVSTPLKGKDAPPPREDGAPANDDLVWAVGGALVAHVVEPTEVRPVACHHLVAVGGGEEATELRLPSPAFLGTLLANLLHHGKRSVARFQVSRTPGPE
jgi:hypothetical protein